MQNFSENLKKYRKEAGISQDELATRMGITAQAVSKWECGLSYPDITLLTPLADLFGITVDEMLRGMGEAKIVDKTVNTPKLHELSIDGLENNDIIKDDGVLRVVQCRGRRILRQDEYDPEVYIPLVIEDSKIPWNVEIFGSANIDGDVNGDMSANGSLSCNTINGDADANDIICCGDIEGDAKSIGNITCDTIEGDATAGDITCDTIEGDANACDIACNTIEGDANAKAGNITCGVIEGDAEGLSITCDVIEGDVNAKMTIKRKRIEDEASADSMELE